MYQGKRAIGSYAKEASAQLGADCIDCGCAGDDAEICYRWEEGEKGRTFLRACTTAPVAADSAVHWRRIDPSIAAESSLDARLPRPRRRCT